MWSTHGKWHPHSPRAAMTKPLFYNKTPKNRPKLISIKHNRPQANFLCWFWTTRLENLGTVGPTEIVISLWGWLHQASYWMYSAFFWGWWSTCARGSTLKVMLNFLCFVAIRVSNYIGKLGTVFEVDLLTDDSHWVAFTLGSELLP